MILIKASFHISISREGFIHIYSYILITCTFTEIIHTYRKSDIHSTAVFEMIEMHASTHPWLALKQSPPSSAASAAAAAATTAACH